MKILILLLMAGYSWADEDFKSEAQEILKPVKMSFRKELKHGLKKGAAEALDICHLQAPHILEENYEGKYMVGRSSDKIRNPQNKAVPWLQEIINEFKNSNLENPKQGKVFQQKEAIVYAEPIYVQPVCLKCHGDPQGDVAKKIKTVYPNDKAVGYKLGDFRGVFYVRKAIP